MKEDTLFFICRKCKGLFPSSNLCAHNQMKCDGNVQNSNAKMFAVDAETMRSLSSCSTKKKPLQTGPVEIVLSDLIANGRDDKGGKTTEASTEITAALPTSVVKTTGNVVNVTVETQSVHSTDSVSNQSEATSSVNSTANVSNQTVATSSVNSTANVSNQAVATSSVNSTANVSNQAVATSSVISTADVFSHTVTTQNEDSTAIVSNMSKPLMSPFSTFVVKSVGEVVNVLTLPSSCSYTVATPSVNCAPTVSNQTLAVSSVKLVSTNSNPNSQVLVIPEKAPVISPVSAQHSIVLNSVVPPIVPNVKILTTLDSLRVADASPNKLQIELNNKRRGEDLEDPAPEQATEVLTSKSQSKKKGKRRRLTVTDAGIIYTTQPVKSKKVSKVKNENGNEQVSIKEEALDDGIDEANLSLDTEEHDEVQVDEHGNPIYKPKVKRNMTTKQWKAQKAAMEVKYESFISAREQAEGGKSSRSWYQCPHCKFKTRQVGFFDRHLNGRHGTDAHFTCSSCDYVCGDRSIFHKHLKMHEKPFICEVCGMRFTCRKDLRRHSWKHTGETPYGCNLCNFKTRFRERVKVHMRSHTGELLHCNVEGCDFTAKYPSGLRMHKMVKHEMGQLLACDQCSYTTRSKNNFYVHQRSHAGIKNYQCSLCLFRGPTRQSVLRHIKTHTKEKDYQCDQCEFSTSHPSAIRSHLMTHMGIKPFRCSSCDYQSVTKQKVQRHITTRDRCRNATIVKVEYHLKINLNDYRISNADSTAGEAVEGEIAAAVNPVEISEEALVEIKVEPKPDTVFEMYPTEQEQEVEEAVSVIYENCDMEQIVLEEDNLIPVSELSLHNYAQKEISYQYQTATSTDDITNDITDGHQSVMIIEGDEVEASNVTGVQEVRRFISDKLGELFIFSNDSETMIVETS